jgi:vitamin B12/bleomycin/antimicrobial peptide transport system ATP-binding/permease protein
LPESGPMDRGTTAEATPNEELLWVKGAFLREIKMTLEVLRASSARGALVWLGLALVVVIGATAYGQIALNAWNQPFYDAISARDLTKFIYELHVFGVIAGALLALNVAQTWLNQMTRMKLREALTRDLFVQWLAPKRAFMLTGETSVNPDQRIHEDARHLADLITDLGVGLLQAALLLASFIGVLWSLSEGVVFQWGGARFSIPGYMVWSALLYAGVASLASWRVGRPLIGLNAEHYAREADLRFALVHANEHKEGIAVYHGETEERERLDALFDRLLLLLRQLVRATTNLTWVTAGYGWFTIVAPILVAAPAYFGGALSIGGLFMSAGAFTQVQQSLRWFVDNAGAIADWRATLHRVAAFRLALLDVDKVGEEAGRIEFAPSPDNRVTIDDLDVFLSSGCLSLSEPHIEVAAGERLLMVGAPGVGKTSLFRAMAGLWRWGAGRIALPHKALALGAGAAPAEDNFVMFLSKRPFIPDGALRDILAYPASQEKFAEAEFVAALARLGLAHLSKDLDRRARWDQLLTHAEQQGIAFARLLLHKPCCVILDEAMETLDAATRAAVLDVFSKELAQTSLICIGGPLAETRFFTRVLHLTLDPCGPRLTPAGGSMDGD